MLPFILEAGRRDGKADGHVDRKPRMCPSIDIVSMRREARVIH